MRTISPPQYVSHPVYHGVTFSKTGASTLLLYPTYRSNHGREQFAQLADDATYEWMKFPEQHGVTTEDGNDPKSRYAEVFVVCPW